MLVAAGLEAKRGRPLQGNGVVLRILPFMAAAVLAYALTPLVPGASDPGNLIAGAMVPVLLAWVLLTPWERLPAWAQALPPLLALVAAALVRDAQGGMEAPFTPVVLLPVFWFALYGTRPQLVVSILAVGATFAIPVVAIGGSAYPATELVAGLGTLTIAGIVGFTISELVRQREVLEERLGRIARTDVLTGLPNRRAWDENLEREVARAGRTGAPLCVALLDLDHFKAFNDLNGHQAGDEHLKSVALRWRARLRPADLIVRHGGEEFAVILIDTTIPLARGAVERLRSSVPGGETVSSGIAEWDRSESGAELVARADLALYEAKRAGRDRAVSVGASVTPDSG